MDEFGIRPLLAAHLQDAVVPAHGLAELLALVNGQRHRLLEVDILSGAAGGDRDDRMLVVGRGDHDGVDIVAREQVLIVFVKVYLAFLPLVGIVFFHAFLETLALDVVHVASGKHLHAVDRQETGQQVHRLLPEADKADVDRVGGGRLGLLGAFGRPGQRRGHEHGAGGTQCGYLQEIAARKFGIRAHLVKVCYTVRVDRACAIVRHKLGIPGRKIKIFRDFVSLLHFMPAFAIFTPRYPI